MPTVISNKHNGPTEGMEELGAKLRSLREAQNLEYEDVTQAIHVRPGILQAIEEGRVLDAVDSVYARGFVKNYCEYLYADDLWKKYKDLFGLAPDDVSVNARDIPSSIGINQPTPMFRRASMLWIYLILFLAVAGAAYLLWWQQKEGGTGGFSGFFLQNNTAAQSAPAGAGGEPYNALSSGDILPSSDLPVAIYLTSPDRAVSAGQRVSADAVGSSIDLSWMDGNTASPVPASRSGDPSGATVQNAAGNKLFIEITGAKCRLEVVQRGLTLTARTLKQGDVRSYDVTSDTDVRFSDGAAAKVVWRGTSYEGIGEENASVLFRFAPTGTMRLIKGKSQYGQ